MSYPEPSLVPESASKKNAMRALIVGGILPVVAFTLIEEYYGTLWGLLAGMAFGLGEILSEKFSQGKVNAITWVGNGLLLAMGAISLATNEGIWFKLQPAIIEGFTALLLIGSVLVRRPLLNVLAKKQNMMAKVPPILEPTFSEALRRFTFRIGIFFLLHTALATWAAYSWSTKAWALLKGVGFTGTLLVYMLAESLWMRRTMAKRAKELYSTVQPNS